MRRTVAALAAAWIAASPLASSAAGNFTPRPTSPRVAPVPPEHRTPEQVAMIRGRDMNIYKTLAIDPELYARWTVLGQFLLNGSSLPPKHREMLMLRMGWLCQAEYEWAQHARIATAPDVGLTEKELRAIAVGPSAPNWTPFEKALLTSVDDLRYQGMISDESWAGLKTQYSDRQVMEALYTAVQYQLVSMTLNSLGVQDDPGLTHQLPQGLPLPATAGIPTARRLTRPRIAPIAVASLTADQKRIAAGQIAADGTMMNLYATLITHPALYGPRTTFGTYLQRDSHLDPRTRELVIMRTSRVISAPYEWAHHVPIAKRAGLTDAEIAAIGKGSAAPNWNEKDRAVLAAVEELRREAFIGDQTWRTLNRYFTAKEMVEIIYTSGGYAMTGAAISSFGIQIEPGFEGFPA